MKVIALVAVLFLVACGKAPTLKNEKAIQGVWKLSSATVDGAATPFDPEFVRFTATTMDNAKPADKAWSGNLAYRMSGNKLIYKQNGADVASDFSFEDKSLILRLTRANKPVVYVYKRPVETDRAQYPAE